jgi:hypothetical protein
MKYFKVWSEYDIGDEDNPYNAYFKAKDIKQVHRHLETYCCANDMDYHEELEDGMFEIQEIEFDSVFINLDKEISDHPEEEEATQWMRDAMDCVPYT